MNGITSSGAKGINALGQRYMGKYHPLMEIGPRYLLIQGTHRELTDGNGPPFVLDLPHIDRDILHHLQYDSMPGDKETWNDYCAQAGIDFSAKPMEVELSELYINGILYLKDNFETRTVKGLFGGSVFNDFSGSICSGYIAGDHAARAAGSTYTELPEPDADELAVGTLACSGTIGCLIPPSTTFIIYGVLAQQSIGDLFAAGSSPASSARCASWPRCGSWSSSSRASPRGCPNPPSTSGWPRSRRGCPSWASSSLSSAAFTAACSRRPKAAASGRSARCCSRSASVRKSSIEVLSAGAA